MIDINWNPDNRQLRQFAVAFLVACGLVGGLLTWQFGAVLVPKILWITGPIVAAIGLALPRAVKPLFIGLTLAAWPIGVVVGTLLLALTYYLIVTPIALGFKLLGKDPMQRKLDRAAPSYWIERRRKTDVGRYFQQY